MRRPAPSTRRSGVSIRTRGDRTANRPPWARALVSSSCSTQPSSAITRPEFPTCRAASGSRTAHSWGLGSRPVITHRARLSCWTITTSPGPSRPAELRDVGDTSSRTSGSTRASAVPLGRTCTRWRYSPVAAATGGVRIRPTWARRTRGGFGIRSASVYGRTRGGMISSPGRRRWVQVPEPRCHPEAWAAAMPASPAG